MNKLELNYKSIYSKYLDFHKTNVEEAIAKRISPIAKLQSKVIQKLLIKANVDSNLTRNFIT